MKTLEQLWADSNFEVGLRVRWRDWGENYLYFVIEGKEKNNKIFGQLDTGEKVSYPASSINWEVYHAGSELTAKAV